MRNVFNKEGTWSGLSCYVENILKRGGGGERHADLFKAYLPFYSTPE